MEQSAEDLRYCAERLFENAGVETNGIVKDILPKAEETRIEVQHVADTLDKTRETVVTTCQVASESYTRLGDMSTEMQSSNQGLLSCFIQEAGRNIECK